MSRTIKIGARSSELSCLQVKEFIAALRMTGCALVIETVSIMTEGDKIPHVPLCDFGGKDLFVKEIDRMLLNGDIDIAVHSAKDIPANLPEGIFIGCVPERADIRDAFVSCKYSSLLKLPLGSVVATCAPRRVAALKRLRPDLNVMHMRGNVPTRIEKIRDNPNIDALILAVAGINRLNITDIPFIKSMNPELFMPAVGQGALGIQCRSDDVAIISILQKVNHFDSYVRLTVERDFVQTVGADCRSSVAALTSIDSDTLAASFMVFSEDGSESYVYKTVSSLSNFAKIGVEAGRHMQCYNYLWNTK